MNIIRDGVLLAAYTFVIILIFIFTSNPVALILSSIATAGSDVPTMNSIYNECIAVYGICMAMLVLIPTIIFIYLAFTTNQEEYIY